MNNPFDYIPSPDCEVAYKKLICHIEKLKHSDSKIDRNLYGALERGKMLGVLIANDAQGRKHTLYAFSGQLGEEDFHHPIFVEPVFDYLQPNGYFKREEQKITLQNKAISLFENSELREAETQMLHKKSELEQEIAQFKAKIKESKSERQKRRESGNINAADETAMTRESQFEKAELTRLKKRATIALSQYKEALQKAQTHLAEMKEKRRRDSEALQEWLFANFRLLNARGESKSLLEIFSNTAIGVPPSGAGECCAPKLLQAAYMRGLKPLSIAEYWYGAPKGGELRIEGCYYPACQGKCRPILTWMLEGVEVFPALDREEICSASQRPEILYENDWFCVVNKPSGMLSVPGKGRAISLQQWLGERYGATRDIKMAHRLDRDTSGLLIATFSAKAYKEMQALFAKRRVSKKYVAMLEGDYQSLGLPRSGQIRLPLSPDWLDRPRQRVDMDNGKEAITIYEFLGSEGKNSRVEFRPATGRTHQLRVHAASSMGLGMPIAGDPLYGNKRCSSSVRLMLHAQTLHFTFPLDGKEYHFEAPPPF